MISNITLFNTHKSFLNFEPEIELLLLGSRKCLDESEISRFKNIAFSLSPSAWNLVISLAKNHSVLPLLINNLQKYCSSYLYPSLANQLKIEYKRNAFRNISLARELLVLLDLFKKNNIPVLSFKGPALTMSVYKEFSLRKFADLDILVAEKDVAKSKELLIANGAKMRFHVVKLTEEEKNAFIQSKTVHKIIRECAYEMDYNNQEFVLELHWEVIPKYFAFPLSIDYLNHNLDSVQLLEQTIPTLSPENNLLLLCGHGSKDCWYKLSRICDIAELINNNLQLNWELVLTEAEKRGGLRIVLIGLLLAHNLLETKLTESVWQKIKRDKKVEIIADKVQSWLFLEKEKRPNPQEQFLFHVQCKDKLSNKLWYALSLLLIPTLSDWELLPKSNFPIIIYYLIRPIRIILSILNIEKK